MEGQRKNSVETEEQYLNDMKAAGIEVTRLNDEQRKLFRDKVAAIYEKYRPIVGEDVMDLALSYSK